MSNNESSREPSPHKPTIGTQEVPSSEGRHSPTRPKPLPFDDAGGVEEVTRNSDSQQRPPMDPSF